MGTKIKAGLALGAITGLVALSGPAMAAGTYTIAVNGDSSGAVYNYNATNNGNVVFTVMHNGSPQVMTCTSVKFDGGTGGINTGAGVSGTNAAMVHSTSANWSGCSFSGLPVNVTPNNPWTLNATGTVSGGVVGGTITPPTAGGNFASVSVLGGICSFTVKGFAAGTFDGPNQQIVVNDPTTSGDLSINTTSGLCSSNVAPGDPASFQGTFDITDTSGNPFPGTGVTISQP